MKKVINIIVICLIVIMLLLIIMPSPLVPTMKSFDEVKSLSDYIANNYSFLHESIFESKSAPISGIAGRNIYFYKEPHTITACYITNPQEQEGFVAIIKEYKSRNRIRSVIVNFYEKEYERKTQVQNGEVVSRGVEGFLCKVKVK